MPASRGSHSAPTPRARASSSLPGPSSPVLPLYILSSPICEQNGKSGVKVYRKVSKTALHYGGGPSFRRPSFQPTGRPRAKPRATDSTGGSLAAMHRARGVPVPGLPPRPPDSSTAASQLGNYHHIALVAATGSKPVTRPIRCRLASLVHTCHRVETRDKGSPPSARHCRFP
jgi:hypothetical protein